jgi:hypothetical protein
MSRLRSIVSQWDEWDVVRLSEYTDGSGWDILLWRFTATGFNMGVFMRGTKVSFYAGSGWRDVVDGYDTPAVIMIALMAILSSDPLV